MMRAAVLPLILVVFAGGCVGNKNSMRLERQTHGQVATERSIAQRADWRLTPSELSQSDRGIEITVRYASNEFLADFFGNAHIFGTFAGPSPFAPEHLVFYIRITNRGKGKIALDPGRFVLLDDHGNQYSPINTDTVIDYQDERHPIKKLANDAVQSAKPGYFGLSLPVGKLISLKSQKPFAQIIRSALQRSILYPGVTYDGLIAFWNPTGSANRVTLLITDLKTDFGPDDLPRTSLEFSYEFQRKASERLETPKPAALPPEPSGPPAPFEAPIQSIPHHELESPDIILPSPGIQPIVPAPTVPSPHPVSLIDKDEKVL